MLELVVQTMNFIWYARNQKVHEGVSMPANQVASQAVNQLLRFKAGKEPPCMQQPIRGTTIAFWSPPSAGYHIGHWTSDAFKGVLA